jgi:hypothetical protein
MIIEIGAMRATVNGWSTCAPMIGMVVVWNPTGVFPVPTHIDIAVVYIVIIRSHVDIVGPLRNPATILPSPLSTVPMPGSLDPHIAIARGSAHLLIQRFWRQARDMICLRSPHSDMGSATDRRPDRVDSTA